MPSVSDDESSRQVARVASTSLPSIASRSGNIDISQQGSVALQTEEAIYILTPALNTSPLLKPEITLTCHHDPSQKVPFFRSLIPLKSCPPDVTKAGSGLDAYMLNYEQRFMDAKWSPSDIGPLMSPILAALTTQSQIFVYTADTNQLKGPWRQLECLNGGSERHIISMAWVEGDAAHAWLLAGTRQGDFIAWRIAAGSVEEHSITQMTEGGIIGVASSPAGFLFLTTTKGVHMAQATQSSNDITFRPAHHQPPAMSGCHISMARWHGTAVLYCTPGQIHYFDVKSGVGQSVLLEKSDDDESCSMRPAISITHLDSGVWEVYLQDGTLYLVSQSSLKKDFITSSSYLPPPNEVIGSLQRQVEAARGLFAKCDDGAGLSYLCHDGNEIASWSYYRDPKCQFGLVLTREPRTSQELPMATQLLEAALKGDSRHLRTLVTFYRYTASNKAKIWSMLIRALQEEIVSRQHVQAALQLSTWLQSEDAKDLMLNSLHERVSEMSLAYALHSRMQSTSARMSTFLDGDDVNFCTRLARAGLALSTRVNHPELQRSAQHLLKSVNKSSDLASYSRDGTFDLEEKCKACGSSVAFQTSNMLIAKCQKGHIWKRCATSFAILTSISNRLCSICSSETMQPLQATSNLQRLLIESISSCDLCHGSFFL